LLLICSIFGIRLRSMRWLCLTVACAMSGSGALTLLALELVLA